MRKQHHFNIVFGVIFGVLFLLTSFLSFVFFSDPKINSSDDRVNILILGKGGKGHSAPDLTDTMVLASISLIKPRIVLVSIPRDIWIPEIRAKINSAYYWGKVKPEFGGGLPFAKATVEKVVGVPVNYGLVLDFSSFKDIIDVLAGIDVMIEGSFTDTQYPIVGKEKDLCDGDKEFKCRYETIHFEKGPLHMDGETALKFVRSRNGNNGENTDLAREARQQKVISAIKDRTLSWQILLNPVKLIRLWRVIRSSVETDIDFQAAIILAKRFLIIDGNIVSYVFPDDLLVVPPKSAKYDYQYVFIPKGENWNEINKWLGPLLTQ